MAATPGAMPELNIIVLGSPEIGKTNYIEKYVSGDITATYEPTAHHVFMKEVMHESKPIKLHIIDVGGAPPPDVDKDALIKKADGIILAYDITKADTFNAVKDIKKHVKELVGDKNVPTVLVGTKSDLEEREVTEAQAGEMAKDLQIMNFETSAVSGTNVEAAFLKLITMITDMRKKTMPADKASTKKKCCQLL